MCNEIAYRKNYIARTLNNASTIDFKVPYYDPNNPPNEIIINHIMVYPGAAISQPFFFIIWCSLINDYITMVSHEGDASDTPSTRLSIPNMLNDTITFKAYKVELDGSLLDVGVCLLIDFTLITYKKLIK